MDVSLAGPLTKAVQTGLVRAAYQPQVSLSDGNLHAVEALARWTDPHLGVVPPDRFIPVAERTGAIVTLGRDVLAAACGFVARWNGSHPDHTPLRASVNVSELQLEHPEFYAHVTAALAQSGLHAESLTLEVTESVVVRHHAASVLWQLKGLGLKVSLDDFGTGFSCLANLTSLPVDQIKLDRGLMSLVLCANSGARIVHAVSHLAHDLGLGVVAEGIESEAQAATARELGCDIGQGFLWAPGLEGAELGDLESVEQHAYAIAHRAARSHSSASGAIERTVLVVEDDPSAAHLCRYLLTGVPGVRVLLASNGEEFASLLHQERADLVLMDLHLPRASGRDLAAAVRRGEFGEPMPVVAYTAYPELLVPQDLGDECFAGVVSKPIEPSTFVHQIQEYLCA